MGTRNFFNLNQEYMIYHQNTQTLLGIQVVTVGIEYSLVASNISIVDICNFISAFLKLYTYILQVCICDVPILSPPSYQTNYESNEKRGN